MEERSKGRDESKDQEMDIEAGLDVITILALRFMHNMGRGFDLLWEEALEGTGETTRFLFEGIQPDEDNQKINAHIVRTRWEHHEEPNRPVNIRSALIELIGGLLAAGRRVLGPGLVQEAVGEAIRMLSIVEKYEGPGTAARAFIAYLEEAAVSPGASPFPSASG